jgi:hypothetical protein
MDMATIRANHRTVRDLAGEIATLCRSAVLPDAALLADARWRFTRQLLSAVTLHDQVIYANLENCCEPEAAAVVRSFREEQERLHITFRDHMLRWTAEAVEGDWPGYRSALAHILDILHERMGREERILYPLAEAMLPAEIAKHRTPRNWARDAWEIRESVS